MEADSNTLYSVLTLLFILCCFYYLHKQYRNASKSFSRNKPASTIASSLSENLLENGRGVLMRTHLQQKLNTAEKWKCQVCHFQNLMDREHCVLCKTLQSEASMVLELNDLQRSARKRKQWKRVRNANGKMRWVQYHYHWDETTTNRFSVGYLTNGSENNRLSFVPTDENKISGINDDDNEIDFYEKCALLTAKLPTLDSGVLKLNIPRQNVAQVSLELLANLQCSELWQKKVWRISFLDEEIAVDAGGLLREWYTITSQQLLEPEFGLFLQDPSSNTYNINPNSAFDYGAHHLDMYEVVGKFFARAIIDAQPLPISLYVPFFKYLLDIPLSFSDLEYLDAELYRSMVYIDQQNTDGLQALCLFFSISEKRGGKIETVHLKDNGDNIPVISEEDKKEYLHLRWKYVLLDRIEPQLRSILSGFEEVISRDLLMAFDYKELEFLLCGFAGVINLDDWRKNTRVSKIMLVEWVDHEKLGIAISWFWEIVAELSEADKSKLLQYTTGSPRVPVQGFQGLTSYDGRICPFEIKAIPFTKENQYIRVHSCFNRIDLPIYDTKEEMQDAFNIILMHMESAAFFSLV